MKVLAVYLILVLHLMDVSIANIALLPISIDLMMDAYRGQWVITSFGIGVIAAIPCVTPLVRWMGDKTALTVVLTVSVLALLVCGLADGFWGMLAGRVLQGLASGTIVLLCQKLMTQLMRPEDTAFALALWMSALAISPVVGPLIGAFMVEVAGWRWIFLVQVPVLLLCATAVRGEFGWRLERTSPAPSLWPAVALGGLLLFVQLTLEAGLGQLWVSQPMFWLYVLLAVFGWNLLVWSLHHGGRRLFDWNLLRDRIYRAHLGFGAMQSGLVVTTTVIYTLWMQLQLDLSLVVVSMILASTGLIAGLLSPVIGKYARDAHRPYLVLAGVCLLVAGFAMTARMTLAADVWDLTWPRVVSGFGVALCSPSSYLMISGLPESKRLEANSLALFGRVLAGNLLLVIGTAFVHGASLRAGERQLAAGWGTPLDTTVVQQGHDLSALLHDLSSTIAMQQAFAVAASLMAGVLLLLMVATVREARRGRGGPRAQVDTRAADA